MRHARNLALIGIALFIAAYLCGAFCETTFYLPDWKPDTRETVVFVWLCFFLTIPLLYFPFADYADNQRATK